MQSHKYQFNRKQLAQTVGSPLVSLVAVAGLLRLAAAIDILPNPRPTLDMDRTILLHQAETSRKPSSAEIIFIGDSSCLMDVSAKQVRELTGKQTIDLATLSVVDWSVHKQLLNLCFAANPDTVRTVVLLMHPEGLWRQELYSYYTEIMDHYLEEKDFYLRNGFAGRMDRWLGLEIFRGRIQSRCQPALLPEVYGRYYGFTSDLWDFMDQHNGSAIDPHQFDPAHADGSAEYWLAPALQAASEQFRAGFPGGVKLIVGITPVPRSFAREGYPFVREEMLREWGEWLRADTLLEGLPPVMDDGLFATVTHLNAQGANQFSRLLAEALLKNDLTNISPSAE